MLINVVDRMGRTEGGGEDQDEEEDLSKSSDNNTGRTKQTHHFSSLMCVGKSAA